VTAATFQAEFASGVRATLTLSLRGMECEWDPELPRNLNLRQRRALIESYRVWRDECLQEFARTNGLEIQVFRVAGFDCIAFKEPKDAKPQ
jgi:hypothetical protein